VNCGRVPVEAYSLGIIWQGRWRIKKVAHLRAALDREGQICCSMNPQRARELSDVDLECTRYREYCAIRIMREF